MAGRYFNPSSSPWNTKLLSITPVHTSNSAYISALQNMVQANTTGWWINRDNYSAPIYEVRGSVTPKVPVTVLDGSNNQYTPLHGGTTAQELAWRMLQGVPIPTGATAAVGTDEHMVVIDIETSEYWEMWVTEYGTRNISGWSCRWGGYMSNHRSNIGIFENPNWGSTATSLPIAAGMILDSEFRAGIIPHALQLVIPDPTDGFVWPANRGDGDSGKVIPEGSRFRIKASVDTSTYSQGSTQATATLRMMAKAMQDYGVVINDRTASGGVVTFRAQPVANEYDMGGYPNNFLSALPWTDIEFIDDSYRPPTVPRVPSVPQERFGFSI